MWRVTVVAAAAIAASVPSRLPSQETRDAVVAVPELSLREAIALAERNDPGYQRALNEVRVADATIREAWGAYLPSLGANASFNGNSSRRLTAFDNFGNAIRLDDPITFRSSQAMQGLSLTYTLFDGGARAHQLRAARIEVEGARARVDASLAELHAEVTRRYHHAVGAAARVELEVRLLGFAREQLEATSRLFAVAGASRVDVLGMEIEVVAREAELGRARSEVLKSRLLLVEMAGIADTAGFHLSDTLPSTATALNQAQDSVVALALMRNPRLRALEADARAAARQAATARGARWPRVLASASLNRSFSDRGYSAMFKMNPPDQYFSFGIAASFPLFDRFHISAQVARADLTAENARYDLRATRLVLAREARAAAIDAQDAAKRVDIARRNVALSRERVELAVAQYRVGAIRFTELQLVLDRAASAERAEIDARVALASALTTLSEKTGDLTEHEQQ